MPVDWNNPAPVRADYERAAYYVAAQGMNYTAKIFAATAPLPEGQALDEWVQLTDVASLLRADVTLEQFVLYTTVSGSFIHAVLIPTKAVSPPDYEDLMRWSTNPYSSWGKCYSFDPPEVWIEPPLAGSSSKTFQGGEQLVFARDSDGLTGEKHYIELLQKFAHIFGLHFVQERSAYCRFDEHGDIEDVVSIVRVDDDSGQYRGGWIVTMDRAVLDEYMALTDTTIVRMFDITRFKPKQFGGWSQPVNSEEKTDGDLHYRYHIEPGHASYMRGIQIVAGRMAREQAARGHGIGPDPNKQYASFIVQDWKNNVICEVSCAPGATANYFTKSDLPFETSPAFFRPEVLLKYKGDSDKYTLKDRSITCRNAWHLETYDINEAGQVHTYVAYLRHLPYQEQLYWKAHNEKPKAPISKRAVTTDFRGEWHQDYDALQSLREVVGVLNDGQFTWWHRRSEQLVDRVHYPATNSSDEWSNDIMQLDQVAVEGFSGKRLRTWAKGLGRAPAERLGSLKLIEECLIGIGCEEERAKEITGPLHEVHGYRSKVKAHDGGPEAARIRKEVLQKHGTYRKHFETLCAGCDEALRSVKAVFEKRP